MLDREIKVVHLEPTDVCQAACPMCAREIDDHFDKKFQHHLTMEQIVEVFDADKIASLDKMFIDELMDNGLDTQGVENGLALLKKMSRERHKSIWLVSHKDELAGRVENILRVVKENGFTSYNTDVDFV